MDLNFEKSLVKAIKTGTVIFGSKKSIELANSGKTKLLILAKNCPHKIKSLISSKDIKIYTYDGTSRELGPVCGKPFTIASMSIIDEGESEILSFCDK